MGFAKKRHLLEALEPDVAILQAVSLKAITESDAPFNTWVGSKPSKGLGVLGYTDRDFEEHLAGSLLPWHLLLTVDGLHIVALWPRRLTSRSSYTGLAHEVVDRHKDFLQHEKALLIGDFNSTANWGHQHKGGSHSQLVGKLEDIGLCSVHHDHEDVEQGREPHPTFYQDRDAERPHHVDYAFLALQPTRLRETAQSSDSSPVCAVISNMCAAAHK